MDILSHTREGTVKYFFLHPDFFFCIFFLLTQSLILLLIELLPVSILNATALHSHHRVTLALQSIFHTTLSSCEVKNMRLDHHRQTLCWTAQNNISKSV